MRKLAYDEVMPDDLAVTITDNQFCSAVKVANKNMSASSSGFGNIMWKACGLGPPASRVHNIMVSMPFRHGFPTSRRCEYLKVMLEKDPTNPLIHRLCIIVILKADFNTTLRIIWMRRLFPVAEKMKYPHVQ